MVTLNRYGDPPALTDCKEMACPSGVVTKMTQTVLTNNAEQMHTYLGKPMPVASIARQLNRVFDFGRKQPVWVSIPHTGVFLIGPDGWELIQENGDF